MSGLYFDYVFSAPSEADFANALDALAQHGLDPANVLGPAPGVPASSYTDEAGQIVTVPARGDPARWYGWVRSSRPPGDVPIDPAQFGLQACDPDQAAAVLGVWA